MTAATLDGVRILLVEDNVFVRRLLQRQLSSFGCVVTAAQDGGDFLTRVVDSVRTSIQAFDLAIVDVQLPDLSGSNIVSWLRDSKVAYLKRLPVLSLTAFPDEVAVDLAAGRTGCRVLPKPHSMQALRSEALRLVRRLH